MAEGGRVGLLPSGAEAAGPGSPTAAVPRGASAASGLPVSLEDPLAVINTLQQVLGGVGLHADLGLPQIAVVGSQSVGKTSVLESIVGRDFLPRGGGIVTRRPLVLQLRTSHKGRTRPPKGATKLPGPEVYEWAEFAHRPQEPFVDFREVCREIQSETLRVCGDAAGISDEPILLRIFSPHVMDLTLVDLPGLTKVPTGEQPDDISDRIRALVHTYVSHDSCLILAVSAANADLATSDALALAREVDPQGKRTLGVLTKLDLADESSGALEALRGRVYPLQLGYVGVVCRSSVASNRGDSYEAALKAEQEFLKKDRIFRSLRDCCGIPFLAKRLHGLLLSHITEALPELRDRLQELAEQFQQELASFGDLDLEKQMGQSAFLLQLITTYARNFGSALEGHLPYNADEALPDRLVHGARLHYIFHRCFGQAILDFEPFSGLGDLEIRAAMRNAAGPKPQLFVPEVAFEMLVKRQIQKLEDPSLQCVHLVYEELKRIAVESEASEMQRFPSLREKLLEVAQAVIRKCLQPTNQMVLDLIQMEMAQINVDHPDFIGGLKAMSVVQGIQDMPDDAHKEALLSLQQFLSGVADRGDRGAAAPTPGYTPLVTDLEGRLEQHSGVIHQASEPLRLPSVPAVVIPSSEVSEKERINVDLLKSLIASYFAIVKRKIIDAIPKTIMHFMVNHVRDTLHHDCIAELYKSNLIEDLLREGEDVRQRREECQTKLAKLRESLDVFARVRDASIAITLA